MSQIIKLCYHFTQETKVHVEVKNKFSNQSIVEIYKQEITVVGHQIPLPCIALLVKGLGTYAPQAPNNSIFFFHSVC